jgi:TPR repeat protein
MRDMTRTSRRVLASVAGLLTVMLLAAALQAADDTARFFGTWTTTTVVNGQTVTIVSVHDARGYRNVVRLPTGDTPAGDGTFTAVDNTWRSNAPAPNDHGTYRFLNNDTVIATNAIGQTVTWIRSKAAAGSGPAGANGSPALDPAMTPGMNAGMQALQRKDYAGAWRAFMAEAQQGNSDGEAAIGSMLFQKTNPPGTGFYAQCEKWLLSAANKGNAHGMDMLAQYYYAEGRNIAGGINPGVNTKAIPPQQQAMAEAKFKLAREWFDRSAAKGDVYAMGNLAVLLDAGVGGPKDPARAAALREAVKRGPDAGFAKKATADPNNLAMSATWQSGHYAEAIKAAQPAADRGDANAEALLGRAYYLGTGVPRNYATALSWLNKAAAQDNADGLFFLGLMYERGNGLTQDVNKALQLFDRAGDKGQHYAQMEARAIRMQNELNRLAAKYPARGGVMETACATAGGVSTAYGECLKLSGPIDPFNAEQASRP